MADADARGLARGDLSVDLRDDRPEPPGRLPAGEGGSRLRRGSPGAEAQHRADPRDPRADPRAPRTHRRTRSGRGGGRGGNLTPAARQRRIAPMGRPTGRGRASRQPQPSGTCRGHASGALLVATPRRGIGRWGPRRCDDVAVDADASGATTVRTMGRISKTTGVEPRSTASTRTARGRSLVTRTRLARSVSERRSRGRRPVTMLDTSRSRSGAVWVQEHADVEEAVVEQGARHDRDPGAHKRAVGDGDGDGIDLDRPVAVKLDAHRGGSVAERRHDGPDDRAVVPAVDQGHLPRRRSVHADRGRLVEDAVTGLARRRSSAGGRRRGCAPLARGRAARRAFGGCS